MIYFHARSSSSGSSSSGGMPGRPGGLRGLWKLGVCMASSNHRKFHGTAPWGVQMTRNHMTRLYKNREVPGRSGMEFHCKLVQGGECALTAARLRPALPLRSWGCSPDSHPSQLLPAQVHPASWGFHEVGGLIRQCFDILGSTVVETKVSVLCSSLEPSAGTAGSNWRLPPRQSFLSGKLLLLWSTAHYPMVQGEESASSSCTKPSRGSHSGWNWKRPYLLHILRD